MLLDFDKLKATAVADEPFPHFAVPVFLPRQHLQGVIDDYPKIDMAGIFPLDTIEGGPMFKQLIKEIQSPEMRAAIGEKFGMDLSNHGTMVTVRACCRPTDGKIHADATFKKATLLLYLNDEEWTHEGGRLRVLRSPTNLDDYAAELAPAGGTLFAFKCVEHAWHGHKPFDGVRRYIMMNFVEDQAMLKREQARHRFTAAIKKFKRLFGFGKFTKA
jgi:SM-20-related protein